MKEAVRRYLDILPVQAPIILYNGTKIHDFHNEKTIYENFLEEEIKDVIKSLKQYDGSLGIEIYCEENVHIFNSCALTERLSKIGYEVYYEISEGTWQKKWTKILILGEAESLNILEENFQLLFGQVNLVRSGERFLEILPQNTSKGNALVNLCELLDIDISKVIAVGDNMNDVEMLTSAGYGFCVANGNSKLLDIIKYKCVSNDEHALEDILSWAEKNLGVRTLEGELCTF